MSRNSAQWTQKPKLPPTHYVDPVIYSDRGIFHQWAFNGKGDCIDIPRGEAGYQERLCKNNLRLKEVRTEVGYGGFVWVNLDDHCGTLAEHIGPALDYMLPELEAEPLETLWYYQAHLNTNLKLIHDTNSEFYHNHLPF